MKPERLQKILARGGLASRRHAESLITEGRVRLNGRIVTELGTKADPRHDRIEVDGKRVIAEHLVYYAMHKPRGFVTTLSDPEGRPSLRELLVPHGIDERIFPVGRLDFHTSGILLLTNDGAFSDGLLHPKRKVPKTYVVKVQGVMQPKDIERWREGVELDDGKTLPADAAFLRFDGDKTWFEITIREGRNQQIRRMGDATGFRVMRLARVAFADVTIEGMRPGELRPLSYEELVELKKKHGVPRNPSAAKAMEPDVKRRRVPIAALKREIAADEQRHGDERRAESRTPGTRERPPRESRGEHGAPAERAARGERGAPAERGARGERGQRGERVPRGQRPERAGERARPRAIAAGRGRPPRAEAPARPARSGEGTRSAGANAHEQRTPRSTWGRDAQGEDRPQGARARHVFERQDSAAPRGAREGGWRGHGPDASEPRDVPRMEGGRPTEPARARRGVNRDAPAQPTGGGGRAPRGPRRR